ncbi:hypothetical protein MKW94_020120 [Papaver nudicaule]|uniref:Uncharacterized protein n=1 Tax=Papaver nudicaule TaxID=74823 RepID=A0AA41W215_PAPNU|nr:hypothetical protein [Papaver nudicaule]
MSWYTNPKLFLYCHGSTRSFHICRIVQKYNVPLFSDDFKNGEKLDFSRHLSLGCNKESDYDALRSWLDETAPITKYVNCQGLVVHWDYRNTVGTWSRVEEDDSIFYSVTGITNPSDTRLAEKKADKKKISELDEDISSLKNIVTYLHDQLKQEKFDRQAQVSYLTAKLEEFRGAGGGTWSRVEEHDSIFYGLPGIKYPFDTVLSLWAEKQKNSISREKMIRKMIKLVEENSLLKKKLDNEVTNLQEQLNKEKKDKTLSKHRF